MYSGGHHHGGFRLYLQRFLCSYRSFVVIFIVFLFTIFVYYYNESLALLRAREIEANRCQQKLDSISAQLQVVYEHKSRLEKALNGDKEACSKRMDDVQKTLKTAKTDLDKSQAELKTVKEKHATLEKQVAALKTEKEASAKAVSKAGADAAQVKNQYAKEAEGYKGENAKLIALVVQLQTALNKSLDQMVLLQQQFDQQSQQLAYLQQRQPGIQVQPSYNAALQPVQQIPMQQLIQPVTQLSILAPPVFNGSNQQVAGQVPQGNAGFVPQTVAVQPQPEQVALPMAEHQQQQLYAQRQVPIQQQQGVGQPAPPAPVLQHPLGEDQQKLLMARPNNVVAAAPVVQAPPPAPVPAMAQPPVPALAQPSVPAVAQAPVPALAQAPAPALAQPAAAAPKVQAVLQPAAPVNNSNPVVPPPAAAQDVDGGGDGDAGAGAGAIYHDIEPVARHFGPNVKAADDYRDDEEENKQKDFDTER